MFQPQQGRIQRALVEIEHAFGDLLDSFGEAEAMLRSHGFQRAQHHQIERAL